MATASVDPDTHLKDSDSEPLNEDSNTTKMSDMLCPVCLDYFDDPKLLPCGHLMCRKCLLHWLQANAMPRTCPECRSPITDEETCRLPSSLSPEEICDCLPTEKCMQSLVSATLKLRGPHACEKCGAEGSCLCLTCCLKLCRECRRKHAKWSNKRLAKAQANREAAVARAGGNSHVGLDDDHLHIRYVPPPRHVIKPIGDLDSKTVADKRQSRCEVHAGEENWIAYFCNTHSNSLCVQCVRESHGRSCIVVTSEEKFVESKKILAETSERLGNYDKRLQQEYELLDQTQKEAEIRTQDLQNKLDGLTDRMLKDIDVVRSKLKADLALSEALPPGEEKMRVQSSLLQSFRSSVKEAVSMTEAESLVRNFKDYSSQVMQDMNQKYSLRSCPHSCTRNHRHNYGQTPAPTENAPEDVQVVPDHLHTQVEEAVEDLERVVLFYGDNPGTSLPADASSARTRNTPSQRHISDID